MRRIVMCLAAALSLGVLCCVPGEEATAGSQGANINSGDGGDEALFSCGEVGGTAKASCEGAGEGSLSFAGESGTEGDQQCCVVDQRLYSSCSGFGHALSSSDEPSWYARFRIIGDRVLISWAKDAESEVEFTAAYEIISDEHDQSGNERIYGSFLRGTLPYLTPEDSKIVNVVVPDTRYYDSTEGMNRPGFPGGSEP